MKRRYKNPPILEAVCEFQFAPSGDWDLTVPGLLFEFLKQDYPIRKQRRQVGLGVSSSEARVEQQLTTRDLVQFVSEDEKSLVQVGQHYLSINRLQPYAGWDDFRPRIKQAYGEYCKTCAPGSISRLGLRYINRIIVPASNVQVEDYFEFYPQLGPDMPQSLNGFISGIEIPYNESRDTERVVLTNASTERGSVGFTLDIDYALRESKSVDLADALGWVDEAHENLIRTFEACLTQRLRELFEEI